MEKLTLTVAQFAILLKVQEQIGFAYENVDAFIKENNGKEKLPELEIDELEHVDMIESIEDFEASLEEGAEKEEVKKWLEELTAESVDETVKPGTEEKEKE